MTSKIFILENIDAAIAAVQAHDEKLIDLDAYQQASECGTLYCTAGLLTQTPHFIERGWTLKFEDTSIFPQIEGHSYIELVYEHFGPDAFRRLFTTYDHGIFDRELQTNSDQPDRLSHKELAIRRLQMQRTFIMENLE